MVNQETLTVKENNVTKEYKHRRYTWKYILSKVFVYLMLILMYAPLLYLVAFSFTDSNITGQWNGFDLECYKRLFSFNNTVSIKIWEAIGNTLLIAVSSALVSTVLGTMGAIGMFYAKKKVRNVLDFITQIPVVNAEIVIAFSLTILFVFCKWEFSFLTLLVGHVVLTLPFIVLSVQPKLKQMDPNLYEAALDLGANQTSALFKVVIPQILPGIFSGFMLAVTLSLDDYIITAFTKPANGFQTISTYVEAVTKKSGLPIQFRALTTIILVAILIGLIIVNIRASHNKKVIKEN